MRRLLPLAALALLTACGNSSNPEASATAAPTPGVYSPGPGVVVPSYTPSVSPSKLVVTWRNCDPQKSQILQPNSDACETSFAVDACQASKSHGDALLEVFIENKGEVEEADLQDCPQYLPTWRKAQRGFADGTHLVPEDVQPGTYQTLGGVQDCYWERNAGGKILANNFITGARSARVTVQKGDETLVTRGCGDWLPA
ncbi:hypothetical protein [Dactylosporangium sp. CA-139066]|uniref:hypothetical protein n=1 Tax=Dactylosporangium sp. CA-139066 TaxID=3239930 RepID=UPI003D8F213B